MINSSGFPPKKKLYQQVFIYAVIGVLNNSFFYILYLLLTHLWGAPKSTMTLLYSASAMIGFFANRRFTFCNDGRIGAAAMRYMFVQLLGYFLNFTLLVLFMDWLGFAHQIVQAVAIVVVAFFMFVLMRFFVFASERPQTGSLQS